MGGGGGGGGGGSLIPVHLMHRCGVVGSNFMTYSIYSNYVCHHYVFIVGLVRCLEAELILRYLLIHVHYCST